MRRTHFLTGILASIGMLILILDGRTALNGAQTGIDLCIRTVIPSLFPFLLLSTLLTGASSGCNFSVLKPLERLCGIPCGTAVILICGFLGGYPTGAQSISAAYTSGGISKEDANRMLSFCNNAGPAFLFGMISTRFSDLATSFLLWGIHILSALLVAFFLPSSPHTSFVISHQKQLTLSDAMRHAIGTMSVICGWVILFRVVISFLDRWFLWMLPVTAQVLITGILELSNGCCELSRITNPDIRFIICACMLSLGGFCVTMQTHCVASVLSIKSYIKGKLMQTLFSLLLSVLFILKIRFSALMMVFLLVIILCKAQKRCRNPAAVSV